MPPFREIPAMPRRVLALLLSAALPLAGTAPAYATAYDAHPRLVVIVVIDQFRADYLQRYRAEFKGRGFRLFLDHGAYFPECYYGYANTKTAPGHATLGTGAYSDGHGINSNEWWDLARNKQRPVSSVEDERYSIIGMDEASPAATPAALQQELATATSPAPAAASNQTQGKAAETSKSADGSAAPMPATPRGSASPRNLLASTIGDELRLATGGAARVYGVSLKDRAAILPSGATANGAFWIDGTSGRFLTSSYYMTQLPAWAQEFNSGPAIAQAVAAAGLAAAPGATAQPGAMAPGAATLSSFYNQVGATNAANTYEIAFAEALIAGEQLGSRNTTDLLTLSLSPNDIEGHHFGPDSPEEHAMVDSLDGDLDSFFTWLDTHVPGGLANVVLALSADHGIAPVPAVSSALGLPGTYVDLRKLLLDLNRAMNAKFSPGENIEYLLAHQELPYLSLNRPAFERAGINEQEAEDAVKAAMEPAFLSLSPSAAPARPPGETGAPGVPGNNAGATLPGSPEAGSPHDGATPVRPAPAPQLFRTYTRQQLAAGEVPPTEFGQLLAHSYSANGGWYVAAIPVAFQMEGYGSGGTTHFSPYSYDRHVPLAFYGAAFAPGTYRGHVEPVDLAPTLASILGVNQPSASIGHVLTEALRPVAEFQYPREPAAPRRGRLRRGQHADTPAGVMTGSEKRSPGPPAAATPPATPPVPAPAAPGPQAPPAGRP